MAEDEDVKSASVDVDGGGRRNDDLLGAIFGMVNEMRKAVPERKKVETDLAYFRYAPIAVMLARWYGAYQFYSNKMEITLWYEENEEPIWFFYIITYILYPISLWKGQRLHRLCVEWRIPLFYATGVNVVHLWYGSIIIRNEMFDLDVFLIIMVLILYIYVAINKLSNCRGRA